MKNYLLILITVLSFLSINNQAKAQAFSAKNFNIDIGYVLGSHKSTFLSPGGMISLEKGIHKWVGIGLYGGVQHNTYINIIITGNTSADHLSAYTGITGSFHFYQMIQDLVGKDIKADKLDISIKHAFGLGIHLRDPSTYSFNFGFSLNARYFFTENIGVYLEAGYPAMGSAVAGLALKF